MSFWRKIRPKGIRFSMAGSVMLLFTGMVAYLAIRFPRYSGLKVALAITVLVNLLFFIRWREKGPGLVDRIMESRFFPRKLTLSREGKFLFLICVGIGFAAVNTGGNLLYLLFSMSLSIIVASGILSELSLRGVTLQCEALPEVVAGLPAHVPMTLRNTKGWFNSFSLEGSLLMQDSAIEQTPGFLQRLAAKESGVVTARLLFPRRGVFRARGFRISTSYPFSFFTKGLNVERDEWLTVLPRGDHPMEAEIRVLARGAEEEDAARTGRGGEFYSARPMGPGDDWHDVYWKGTARTGRYMVKEYQGLTGRRVLLDLGLSGNFPQLGEAPGHTRKKQRKGPLVDQDRRDRLEKGIELGASVARQLLLWGYDVGLRAPNGVLAPAGGENAVRPLLRQMARLGYTQAAGGDSAGAGLGRDLVEEMRVKVVVRVDLETHEIVVTEGRLPAGEGAV